MSQYYVFATKSHYKMHNGQKENMLVFQSSGHICWEVLDIISFSAQEFDDIHVTILHKEEDTGLGFSLAGGVDLENKVVTVSSTFLNIYSENNYSV